MNSFTLIAEIGLNHDGDFDKAKRMIEAAKVAGADIAKFQHYDALKLLGKDSPYLAYANSCYFTKEQHERLALFSHSLGIEYLVSVFDINDIPWANSICRRHKVASRMNQDNAFKQALYETRKNLIVSVHTPIVLPTPRVTYLFCITEYPTPVEKMQHLPCGPDLGLSSHCADIRPTLSAIEAGAPIIEHHVCFSRTEGGCDKSSSITFEELKVLADAR